MPKHKFKKGDVVVVHGYDGRDFERTIVACYDDIPEGYRVDEPVPEKGDKENPGHVSWNSERMTLVRKAGK